MGISWKSTTLHLGHMSVFIMPRFVVQHVTVMSYVLWGFIICSILAGFLAAYLVLFLFFRYLNFIVKGLDHT